MNHICPARIKTFSILDEWVNNVMNLESYYQFIKHIPYSIVKGIKNDNTYFKLNLSERWWSSIFFSWHSYVHTVNWVGLSIICHIEWLWDGPKIRTPIIIQYSSIVRNLNGFLVRKDNTIVELLTNSATDGSNPMWWQCSIDLYVERHTGDFFFFCW